MKNKRMTTICIFWGLLLLLIGLQFTVVDAFVLTPQATRFAARWLGPSPGTPGGWLHQIAFATSAPRTAVEPASWVRWAVLSTAFVVLAHGVLQKMRK